MAAECRVTSTATGSLASLALPLASTSPRHSDTPSPESPSCRFTRGEVLWALNQRNWNTNTQRRSCTASSTGLMLERGGMYLRRSLSATLWGGLYASAVTSFLCHFTVWSQLCAPAIDGSSFFPFFIRQTTPIPNNWAIIWFFPPNGRKSRAFSPVIIKETEKNSLRFRSLILRVSRVYFSIPGSSNIHTTKSRGF